MAKRFQQNAVSLVKKLDHFKSSLPATRTAKRFDADLAAFPAHLSVLVRPIAHRATAGFFKAERLEFELRGSSQQLPAVCTIAGGRSPQASSNSALITYQSVMSSLDDIMPTACNSSEAADVKPLTIYFDGLCALCSVEIDYYARQRGAESLCFADASAPGAQTGVDLARDVAMRRFHVRRADGQLLSGARAFVAIWETLPAWRPLARLARFPGAILVLECAYRIFLPARPLLSRIAKGLGARPRRENAGVAIDANRQCLPDRKRLSVCTYLGWLVCGRLVGVVAYFWL